ncbi:FAD-dependent monooxygenase [Agromyces sp. MMS24-JH15]|uniref:FAD-dependent monooxygenase n=1 Tax=Agromyces sp. MMS24-JH15 TaxID=3243765 RepID=UPI003747DF5F
MAVSVVTTDVLVVGAGPTGLMLAACLARLGVAAELVDGKDGPTRESRALVVQARTLEVYDQLGVVDRALAEGRAIRAVVPGSRDRAFGRIEIGRLGSGVSAFDEVLSLEQSRNESLLADFVAARGRDIRWRHALRDFRVVDDAGAGVVATLDGPDGEVEVRARYLVGTDGARSTVREALGIPFEGRTNEHTYFVADATGTTGLAEGDVNLRFADDDLLLGFPMGGEGRFRLLGIVRERDLAADGSLPEASVRDRLERTFGVRYRDRSWYATYRVHHRLAARFRAGPCFLAGDAAHIHSPVGGQGMNTGLQEAHNLACAFADVLVGGMPDARLDRYESERRPVGRILVESTDRAFEAVTAEGGLARFVRARVAPRIGPWLVGAVPRVVGGDRLFGSLSQTRIRYRMTPPGARVVPDDPAVGLRLPWTGGNHVALRAFTWQVHGYGAPTALVERVGDALGLEHHVFAPDAAGRLRADRLYLVRRDGFVAAAASADPRRRGVPASFLAQLHA